MIEYVIVMIVYVMIKWYYDYRYGKKLVELMDKIEDLMIEKYRAKKDMVNLISVVGEKLVEIGEKDERIRELEGEVEKLQMRPMRPKRHRVDDD